MPKFNVRSDATLMSYEFNGTVYELAKYVKLLPPGKYTVDGGTKTGKLEVVTAMWWDVYPYEESDAP